jgi:repressor LexA
MPSELTPKQRKVLEYLHNHKNETGLTPSLREAAAGLGVSHASVAQFIRILESKGFLQRKGRYSREIHLSERNFALAAGPQGRRIPIVGKIAAGLPLYAQEEWDGGVVVDATVFKGQHLFALRVKGDSMKDAGIFDRDLVICQPRQYARDGEIVVVLIDHDEATVKRVFLRKDHIELRPENDRYATVKYDFSEVLIQGKVIGVLRGPDRIE